MHNQRLIDSEGYLKSFSQNDKELTNGEIIGFNKDMSNRYKQIENCNEPNCYIPELNNQPKTLFVYPLSDDSSHWLNESYQVYFNSGKIIKVDPR